MKFVLISFLSLLSSVAMADGFRCQSSDFRVKLYNETQPERGTRNPAVLVVFEKGVGTLATLKGEEILKTNDEEFVTYEGQTNSRVDGRFVGVKFEIKKFPEESGINEGFFKALLTVNADNATREQTLVCERYLKREQ